MNEFFRLTLVLIFSFLAAFTLTTVFVVTETKPTVGLPTVFACEQSVPQWRDECYFRAAIHRKDIELCGWLQEEHGRVCKAVIEDDLGACPSFDEYFKNWCFYGLGVLREDTKLCAATGNYSGECYYELGILRKNAGLCEKAGARRQECLNRIS